MVFTVPRDGEIFIDQVIERCKNLISSGIWEGLSPVRLDTWMKNFTSGQERYFGACVLDSLIYRSEKQTVALMEQLFQGTLPDFIRREPPPGNPTAPVYAKKLTQDEADKLVDDAYMAFYIVQTIAPIYLEPSNSVFPYYGRPRDEDYWLRLFFAGRQQKWPATMMDVIILWVANVRKCKEPLFLPGVQFLTALIGHLKAALPVLQGALYFVYVDEFENLLHYQQRILNTCIKHSEVPLIFNIAMKRHAFETLQTVGAESIQDIADYRKHDLEAYLLETNFDVFAAEVLFLNLEQAGLNGIPVLVEKLRDPNALGERREKAYQDRVLARAREMFPGLAHEELARLAFASDSLKLKARERIEKALEARGSPVKIELLFRPEFPQATITVTALLHRRRLAVEEVVSELDLLAAGKENKFTAGPGWIHNNFIGCLLWLYESHAAVCPFFAGFDTFCLMARGNLRHFLELCHTSLNQVSDGLHADRFSVPPELQAKAARQASTAFLNEIPAFGRQGDRLHTFVFRLGSLFALAHRRPTQSEPEQGHFAITSGARALSPEDLKFLREAEKWSVLFVEEETKLKSDTQFASVEYILNPVYSPYFNITCRKKRKLGLSTDDLDVLIHGSFDSATELLRRFSKQWEIEGAPAETLFFRFAEEPLK